MSIKTVVRVQEEAILVAAFRQTLFGEPGISRDEAAKLTETWIKSGGLVEYVDLPFHLGITEGPKDA